MASHIERGKFLAALGGAAAAACPLAARGGTGGPGPRCDRGHGDSHLAAGHHGEAVMTRRRLQTHQRHGNEFISSSR